MLTTSHSALSRSALPFTALVVLAVLSVGCGSSSGEAPEGHVTLEGRLVDAETGEAVSREGIFVHLFCDDLGVKNSIEREDTAAYRAFMPGETIRVRVFDPENRYQRFEETITVSGDARTFDIELQPTGFVTMHGQVVVGDTGELVIPERGEMLGDGGPFFNFSSETGSFRSGMISIDNSGSYAVKVPRGSIRIDSLNAPTSPAERVVDLTDYDGDTFEYDIQMK